MLGNLLLAPAALAYRPFATEDAGVAGQGMAQMEVSLDHLSWGKEDKEQSLLWVPIYGLTDRLELSCEIPYMFHDPQEGRNTDGIGDANVVGKWLLGEETPRRPALVAKGILKTTTGNEKRGHGSGDIDVSLVAAATKTVGSTVLHAMFGFTDVGDRHSENLQDIYLYGIAADHRLTDAWHLVAEVSGNRHPDRNVNDDPRSVLLGFTCAASKKLLWDASVRIGLNDAVADWTASTGVSITF
jgi:hypothetical protein